MGQTVYADLYFLINFSMDFLCLFLTAKLLSLPFSFWRALLAAALGGIYAVIALFFSGSALLALIIDMMVCALLCAVAFAKRRSLRSLPLYILVLIAISMALGGIMTALFHVFNRLTLPKTQASTDGISVWFFAILAILGGLLTRLGSQFFARRSAQKRATVTVWLNGRSAKLQGLCDSGNLLRDPMDGKPCIVADADALRSQLPKDIPPALENASLATLPRSDACTKRLRLIPTQTATGNGLLVGIRADRITVDWGKGDREADALIVLSSLKQTADGACALLPSELFL